MRLRLTQIEIYLLDAVLEDLRSLSRRDTKQRSLESLSGAPRF